MEGLDDKLKKDEVENLYNMLTAESRKNQMDHELALGIIEGLGKRDIFSLWTRLSTCGKSIDPRITKVIQERMYYAI